MQKAITLPVLLTGLIMSLLSCSDTTDNNLPTLHNKDTLLVRFADFKIVLTNIRVYNEPDNSNPDTIPLFLEAGFCCNDKFMGINCHNDSLNIQIFYTQTNEILLIDTITPGSEIRYKKLYSYTSDPKTVKKINGVYTIKTNPEPSSLNLNYSGLSKINLHPSGYKPETFVSGLLIQIHTRNKISHQINNKYINLINQVES